MNILYDVFLIRVWGTYQHISGYIRMEPACNRGYDTLFISLSHRYITRQAHLYDISPSHIILATGQSFFALVCEW